MSKYAVKESVDLKNQYLDMEKGTEGTYSQKAYPNGEFSIKLWLCNSFFCFLALQPWSNSEYVISHFDNF